MLKIYGRTTSYNTMKVLFTLTELKLPFTKIDTGGEFNNGRTPEYLALNPNGLVPTIDDEGFILWESNAIMRYLAAKHDPNGLISSDLKKRAEIEHWMDWQLHTLNGAIGPVFVQTIRTPKEKQNPQSIAEAVKKCADVFQIIERNLEGKSYMCGSRFTLADIPVACWLHRWYNFPIERPAMKNFDAYYDRVKSREGFQKWVVQPVT